MKEAVWELMNRPHPLDTLSEPAAYGDLGSISRCGGGTGQAALPLPLADSSDAASQERQ